VKREGGGGEMREREREREGNLHIHRSLYILMALLYIWHLCHRPSVVEVGPEKSFRTFQFVNSYKHKSHGRNEVEGRK
jgi:hypothetical protein